MSTKSLLVKIITFISMQPEKHVPEANDIYILNKLERCDSLNSECVFNWSASFEGNNTWLIWHGRRVEVLWKKIFPDSKKALKYQHFGLLMIFRNFFFFSECISCFLTTILKDGEKCDLFSSFKVTLTNIRNNWTSIKLIQYLVSLMTWILSHQLLEENRMETQLYFSLGPPGSKTFFFSLF